MKSDIAAARARIAGHVRVTPTMGAQIAGHDLELKFELLQHTGSFKARGAFNNLLSRPVPDAGIVAASGGNHGAAAAYAALALGHKARIFVPELAGATKINLIRATGADCEVVPGTYADALEQALDYEARTGAIQLHAYDAPETVAGQGTLFAEWDAQGLAADTVLIAVGGGGLIGGALGWFRGARRLVAVEPERAPTLNRALADGPETQVEVSGVAANSLGARQIGRISYGLAQEFGVESILVPDEAILAAQMLLWDGLRVLAEPGGATALAALVSGAYQPAPGEKLGVLICGGNVSAPPLAGTAS